MKWIRFAGFCILIVAVAAYTAVRFGGAEIRRLENENSRLQEERRRLVEFAERLGAHRRVAQVDVVRQYVNQAGQTVSTLLWQEIGPDGMRGKPLALEAVGVQVYFEAFVIKFKTQFVGEGDPQRGTSVALFRRIFGEAQRPDSALELDLQARPPLRIDAAAMEFQQDLWRRFWDLVEDPDLAAGYGVRVAQCEAPAVRLSAGQTWEVILDANGGLNLRNVLDVGDKISAPLLSVGG